MNNNIIITLGRQYGCGGHEIGKRLSEKLNIPYYDKDIIASEAKKSGEHELLSTAKEQSINLLQYSLSMSNYNFNDAIRNNSELFVSDRLFQLQSEAIKSLAAQGPCIIIGRCANYVLSEAGYKCLNIFICGDLQDRAQRIAASNNISLQHAKEFIQEMDKRRNLYYNYFTGNNWDNMKNYNITLNSTTLGIDVCVSIIDSLTQLYSRELLSEEV